MVSARCGTLRNGHRWAEEATLLPGWKQLGNAAVHAVISPYTWLPVNGAVVLQLSHLEKRLSNWAVDHTPVFGSRQHALHATSTIRNTTDITLYSSMLNTPSGNKPLLFWIANEKLLTLLLLLNPDFSVKEQINLNIAHDLSGLCRDPTTDALWMVSDESKLLIHREKTTGLI